MEFAILGPLEVRRDGRAAALGGPKQRALLAILLLHANEVVSRDRLIEGLWDERPPAAAQRSIDSYVSRLRTQLGKDRVMSRPPGYALRVEPGELDLERFELRVEAACTASSAGDPAGAVKGLAAALALWRGPALADLTFEPFARVEVERLEDRRLLAVEELNDARLALGQDAELVAELRRLVREHPFREPMLAQLMLALYRAGRQADALAAFQRGRRQLAEELGLDPGLPLRDLERRILEQDPALDAPRNALARARSTTGRSRLFAALGVLGVAAVAATAILLTARGGERAEPTARSNEIVGLRTSDATQAAAVELAGAPSALGADGTSLWVADADAGTVSRIDLTARALVDRVPVGESPGTLAVGGGSVWVASVPGAKVSRIDPATATVTQPIGLGGARVADLAYGAHGVWVADTTDNTLIELDPETGGARRTLTVDLRPTALAVSAEAIWVADYDAQAVAEIDPVSGQTVAAVTVGKGPSALAIADGAVWVANALDSTVSRIDPRRGSVVATIPVGSGPSALAFTPGSVWVANQYSSSVSRIDVRRNAVVRTILVGGQPTTLATTKGRLWVGIRPVAQRRGGILRLVHSRPLSIDPAVQGDLPPPQSDGLTRDGLVSYNHASGPDGVQLVPDLALSVPTPTDRGTTYTFRLRPGIRYSNGQPMRAGDFRRAIERVFNLRSYGMGLLDGIRGARACTRLDSNVCDLRQGIVANDGARTVTFHLDAPDLGFLADLATGGLATPVPPGTPARNPSPTPIPGTGPYKVTVANRREVRYVRNPYFREWSHAAQPNGNPDEIVWRFGLSPTEEVRAIEQGRADWMADAVPGQLLAGLATRRASQLHAFPTTETDFFQLNTTRAPFDDVRVRQALNLAIDRREIVRIYGGTVAASATCQVLPPGIAGFHRYCPYTLHPDSKGRWSSPDVARAQRLVLASGTRGARITVWGWTDDPTISPRVITYTAGVLRRLGYRVRVRLERHADFDALPSYVRRNVQLIPAGWLDTSAYNFISTWLSCGGAIDHGKFCNRGLDRAMRHAHALEAANPRVAALLWSRIDRELVDRAVWLPLVNPRQIDFVSARVRNFQHHPYWDILADQLSVR